MPIRPENRKRYPAEWPYISLVIRWFRALGQCECRGECAGTPRIPVHSGPGGRCLAVNTLANPRTGSVVVLTVAHLDHTPENCHPANLRAMCQGCHLRYDREHHAETARATRARRLAAGGVLPLPLETP